VSDYRALTSIDAIRINTGMFIGSTETPDHLIEEVLDNMLDEITNGYADIGKMSVEQDSSVWISDNGRGIKTGEMEDPDTGEYKDNIELLTTKLFSGSKFRTDDSAIDYQVQIGMHGVGLCVVNALSDWFVLATRDRVNRNILHVYKFENAILIEKNQIEDNNYEYSTLIGFKPSEHYFDYLDIDLERFASRLVLAQCLLNNIQFYINNQKIPEIQLEHYIREKLQIDDSDILHHISYNKSESEQIDIYFTYVDQLDTICMGSVNLRECDGTYLTNFQTSLKNILKNKIDKKFKNINLNELLCGLRCYIILTVPKPQFDSQEKTRMTINITKQLITPIKDKIESICSKKQILNTIENILNRKFQKKITTQKKISKRISSDSKLKDCEKIPGDILYIVEGDSAGGTLTEARNVKSEALYALSGKSLNVEKASLDKLKNNKEFSDLREALGPKDQRRYKQIKILADADIDGYHIIVLTVLMIAKLADDMIQSGNVSIIMPPLFGAIKNNQFVPIYFQNDLQTYRNQNYKIVRFKGLGEMNADQLEQVIRSGNEYTLTYPNETDLENLRLLILDTELRKEIMDDPRCSVEEILNLTFKNS